MHRLALCAVLSMLCLLCGARAQERLVLSGFDAPNLSPAAEKILSEAYAELGLEIEVVKSSPARALLDAASGKTDGELVRVREIAHLHESLIRVDVPVIVARSFAFTNKPELKGTNFSDLKHLRVGHVAGALFAESLSADFAEVWTADTPEQLFEMLLRDRIDLVIAGEDTGQRIIRDRSLENVFALLPSLREVAFYHYLHERHRDLVPRVEKVLRELASEPEDETDRNGS